jgi:hypothetical protein
MSAQDAHPHAVTLRACSGDAIFLNELRAHGFSGCVHSVFDRVINIESVKGELWTLAGCECDNAPNTLIVDVPRFTRYGMLRGDSCKISGRDEFRFGSGMRVAFGQAASWSGRIPAYPQNDSLLRANLQLIASNLSQHGMSGGFLAVSEKESTYLHTAYAMLKQQTAELVEALSQGDLEAACKSAVHIVGLGPGLTPSGDDFLTGFFSVLNIEGSPGYRFRNLCDDVVLQADKLTNAISFSALKMAAGGRVRESIIALLRNMMYGDSTCLHVSLSRVLAIGSTSGSDIASGILSGFKLNA